jgi:ribosomal-protein-alanine N-acetyltransferase
MDDIKLTQMTDTHIGQVLAIERAVFDSPWTSQMFQQQVRGVFGSIPTVAVIDGRVVGYQVAWFVEDEVHLVNIAVRRGYQERGIGSMLLRHLIEDALEQRKAIITLEVRANNNVAQAFYHRFLFRTIGVRKGYYSDNREDALLMALDLSNFSHRRGVVEGRTKAR